MKILSISLLSLFISTAAQADLVEEITREPASEEVVLQESFLQTSGWNEPIFSSQGRQRDIAASVVLGSHQEVDSYDQLSVQREIAFTYPVVTRRTLQLRALNEIEAEEDKK